MVTTRKQESRTRELCSRKRKYKTQAEAEAEAGSSAGAGARVEVERALGERDQVARAEHGEVVERERLQRDRRVRRGHHRAQLQEHGEVVGSTHHTLVLRTREQRT